MKKWEFCFIKINSGRINGEELTNINKQEGWEVVQIFENSENMILLKRPLKTLKKKGKK